MKISNMKAFWIWLTFVARLLFKWFCSLWNSPPFCMQSLQLQSEATVLEYSSWLTSDWSVF